MGQGHKTFKNATIISCNSDEKCILESRQTTDKTSLSFHLEKLMPKNLVKEEFLYERRCAKGYHQPMKTWEVVVKPCL
jgi:hypothetical protein